MTYCGNPSWSFYYRDLAKALRGRRLGPLFLIDIAVPRDIDPRANELDSVYLYDIDALQNELIEIRRDLHRQTKA